MNDINKDTEIEEDANINSENEGTSNIGKNKLLRRMMIGLALVASIIASILVINSNENVGEAGVAIGGSNTISIKNVGTSTGLTHFGVQYPLIYITLDETGVGVPAGFDYEATDASRELTKILLNDKNSYGGYLPATEDSTLCFVPYAANSYLSGNGYTGGMTRSAIWNTVNMAWSKGAGSGELYKEKGSSKSIIKTINSSNSTPSNSRSNLGSEFTGGIYYKDIKKLDGTGELVKKWGTLVKSDTITSSLHLWNYFTDFSGNNFEITERINSYLHSNSAKDDADRGYRYLDLLLTGYSMAKGSSAANTWKAAINNYINNNGVAANGASKGSNIIIHTGVIYNKERDIYFMTHMDAINFTMGMTSNGDMSNKRIGSKIQELSMSRAAGLTTSNNTYQFNLRLREAYGKSYKAAPDASRTAWAGATTFFGSSIVSYVIEQRPEKNDWKTFRALSNPFIKTLYLDIAQSNGTVNKHAYGLNVILANAWTAEPSLAMTSTVNWTKNKTRKISLDGESRANIKDSVTFKINLTTKDISSWKALAKKYSKSAALIKVKRHTVKVSNEDKRADLSTIKNFKLGRYDTAGKLRASEELTFYAYGTSAELIKLLENSNSTLDIFTDEATLTQGIKHGETQVYGYDISIKIEMYNGSVGNPSSKYIYGQSDDEPTGIYKDYKYSELKTKTKRSKMMVTASKGTTTPSPTPTPTLPPDEEEEIYEYVQYISEPEAYAELKEGTVNAGGTNSIENFEAMAGVPSTETLYFTSGGSEFIAEIYMQKIEDEESERKYTSWYNANSSGCEFKPGDTLKGGTGTYSHTETFVADSDGNDQNKSVKAEDSKIVTPNGNSGGNITISGHSSSSTIWSQWTGTIGNSTSEPADIGKFDAGKPGSPCPGQGYDVGEQRTKAEPTTNWSVDAYNADLAKAIDWAGKMEATNSDYTVKRIADSDGQIRMWTIGTAVIQVTMTGGSNGHSHTQNPGFGKNGTYTSGSASGATVQGTDKGVLGNGWGWTDGVYATGTHSGCCAHGGTPHKEWDTVPKPAVPAVPAVPADEDGNGGSAAVPEVPAVIGVKHAYNHSDSFTAGRDLTQSASPTINYTIKVTFKDSKTKQGGNFDGTSALGGSTTITSGVLSAHALCGPDCRHDTLPAVYDKWSQKLQYDYMRINAVNIFKISRSYVGGMEVITYSEDEDVSAGINRGDPNIFYNIAEENDNYSSDDAKSPSLAGRIRYSLQSQQHDIVTWREKSTDGDSRTNKCDGTTRTVAGNAVPSGGSGHSNQKWANGILYNNKTTFTTDEEWFKTIATTADKAGYSNNYVDLIDKETEEYIRFDERRTTDNTAVIVSDMLILQTSTGDQSVMYFTKEQTVTAQEHYGEDKELDATVSEMWHNNSLSAANWGTKQINVGGYTGDYFTPTNKFSSGASTIPTVFDSDGSDYDATANHTDADATVAGPLTYSTVSNAVNTLDADSYRSSPAKLQKRMSKVELLKIVTDNIIQNPINPNKEYLTGEATQFYIEILSYKRETLEDANREDYEFEYEPEEDDVLDIEGFAEAAVYGHGHSKINDIVVHDPVSVQNAAIVELDSSRDQRSELSLAASENLMDEINQLDYCPGTPELCDYRYLNCKYFQDIALLSLNFNPKSTIVTVGTDGSAPTREIQTVKTVTDDAGNSTTSVVDTINQLEYVLPDGFTIDKTDIFGTGDSLKANGTRLSIPLSDLGLSYKASNKVQVEMNFFMPGGQSGGTMIVSFYGYDFYIPVASDGIATWNTGNGPEKIINGTSFVGRNMKLRIIFSMNNLEDNEVYVDGVKVTDYTRVNASADIEAGIVGDYINIGSWNSSDAYPAKFYIDNLVITKLAGSHTHDLSCYTETYTEQKFTNYICKEPVDFGYTGGVQTFTAPASGYYKLEAWGASGGGTEKKTASSHAGYGGYTSGKIYLKQGEAITVNVGGQGVRSTAIGNGGGYNGGGHGGPGGYGGGGFTEIKGNTTRKYDAKGAWFNSNYATLNSDGSLTLKPGAHMSGPAKRLGVTKGVKYTVNVYGTGLDKGKAIVYDNWSVNKNANTTLNYISRSDTHVVYTFTAQVDSASAEFTWDQLASTTGTSVFKYLTVKANDRGIISGGGGGSDNSFDGAPVGSGDDGSGGDGGGLIGEGASIGGVKIETKEFDGATWAKIFHQDTSDGTYFTGDADAVNSLLPNRFSILNKLDKFTNTSGKYEFMLEYPGISGYNRWKQTKNPVNEIETSSGGAALGYEPIHTAWVDQYGGGGLVKSSQPIALLDGNTNVTDWWFAIGQNGQYVADPTVMPGPPGTVVKKVDLWVRVDNTKFTTSALHNGGLGIGGTQTSGYALGQGESVTYATDTGGAGGGYYGGYVTNHGNGGGGGGSSYTGGVMEGANLQGVNYGNGKARITLEEHTHQVYCKTEVTDYNEHVHNAGCITAGSSELVNALQADNRVLLKALLGNTVYNSLKTPSGTMYTWDNWSTADMKQFRELRGVKLSANDSGNLVATSTASDPYFDVPVNIRAYSVDKVRVLARLVGTTSSYSYMLFTNNQFSDYTGEAISRADINADSNWQWIEFDMSNNSAWSGNISGLRFDIVGNDNSAGRVEIDKIELVGSGSVSEATPIKVLSTYSGFTANNKQYGITNIQATNTFSGGNIVSTGNLGSWEFKLPVNIDTTEALKAVRVTMINQTNAGNMGVRNSESEVEYFATMVPNSAVTQVITIDTRGMAGPTSSLWFDTAAGNATGTTKISKIELIGYGNQTVEPAESYTSGAYNAHIHTENCRYTPAEGKWTTCNGALNTYSDLVGANAPVERGEVPGSKAFNYTGGVQTFTAPGTGAYTFEVWGAQGGHSQYDSRIQGGLGGYSKGQITLNQGETINIYVGGQGGYNGGGSGNSTGANGGGASDVRRGGTALGNRFIVAGGGGGCEYQASPGNDGTMNSGPFPQYGGGHGGGTAGLQGLGDYTGSGNGSGGTQTSGYAQGQGQTSNGGHSGAGGGGYYGGYAGSTDNHAGGGGSGYIGGVTGGTMSNGVQSGNGKATISWGGDSYYSGATYAAPASRYNYSNTPATIVYAAPLPVSSTASYGFSYLDGTYSGVLKTIEQISQYYDTVPQTIGGKINPIFSCQSKPNVHVHTDECRTPIKKLTCTEPHHNGTHYDGSNPICWDACDNDANHKSHPIDVKDGAGKAVKGAKFINTDYAFQVYFPNTGDFYQTDWNGISSTVSTRGKGYVGNMDTTKWTREKRIMFSYDVLFFNNGTWEQYLAGDWIELPVTGNTYPYYDFYCTLNNYERASADVHYQVEAINCDPSPGGKASAYERDTDINNDNFVAVTNKERFSNLTSYHGAFKSSYIDLVGRIGNLLISDTDDMRFSNFFKTIKSDKWIINGIINDVYGGDQARYLSWHKNSGELATDIRGMQVDTVTGMYNTWGTQAWTSTAEAVELPLSAEKNNIVQLREDPLKPGYDVLFEISTMGNYQEVGLQILPYFYALNTGTGELIPVDIWMTIGEEYKAINIHKLSDYAYYWDILGSNNAVAMGAITDKNWVAYKNSGLFDYVLNLDWLGEQERRNYDLEEQLITERVSLNYTTQIDSGNETATKLLEVPIGSNYALGTLQLLNPSGKARTFIGSGNTNTVNLNGGTNTNIGGLIEEIKYNYMAQRWHLKLGLPSSAVFTKYINEEHLHPTKLVIKDGEQITASEELSEDEWAIIMTADIKSIGSTWVLKYDQGIDNGTVTINGKTFVLPSSIPTVLAVYDSTVTSTSDVDSIGTH